MSEMSVILSTLLTAGTPAGSVNADRDRLNPVPAHLEQFLGEIQKGSSDKEEARKYADACSTCHLRYLL